MILNEIQTVIGIRMDKQVLLSCGNKLQEIQKELNGEYFQLNVPQHAPPDIPRGIIQSRDTLVNIAPDRVEIFSKIPEHIKNNFDSASNFALSKNHLVFNHLAKNIEYKWIGMIYVIKFDIGDFKNSSDANNSIFDKLVKIDKLNKNLSSIELRFGFEDDGFFKNFVLTGFETRIINVSPAELQERELELDIKNFPITKAGYQITIDINNKPNKIKSSLIADSEKIITVSKHTFANLDKTLNMEGVLYAASSTK